jgi:protein required for attachment to host cells
MAIQWILVAQRAGAKIFQSNASGAKLHLIQDIKHPTGRLKDGELVSAKAGSLFSPAAGNAARSATDSENTPHDHDAQMFANELAQIIEKGRVLNSFDQLILVAEPRFMGRLRAALSRSADHKLVSIIEKDLAHLTEFELAQKLSGLLAA